MKKMDGDYTIDKELKKILGDGYNGLSMAFNEGEFIIYNRFNIDPTSIDIIAVGITIEECIKDYHRMKGLKNV